MPRGRKGVPAAPAIDPKKMDEAVRVIRMGQPIIVACRFAGISKTAFFKWVQVGKRRPEGDPLREFAESVAKAKESASVLALGSVFKGMQKDWKAAAWFLGVTKPAEFGQKVRVTLEEEFSSAIENLEQDFSDQPELLGKILASITRRQSRRGEATAGLEAVVGGEEYDPEPP